MSNSEQELDKLFADLTLKAVYSDKATKDWHTIIAETKEAVKAHTDGMMKEAASKIFIDIQTGHKITQMTLRNTRHDSKCSSHSGFMCDCEVINAAQYAVDQAKERVLNATNNIQKGKKSYE